MCGIWGKYKTTQMPHPLNFLFFSDHYHPIYTQTTQADGKWHNTYIRQRTNQKQRLRLPKGIKLVDIAIQELSESQNYQIYIMYYTLLTTQIKLSKFRLKCLSNLKLS